MNIDKLYKIINKVVILSLQSNKSNLEYVNKVMTRSKL